LLVPVKGKKKKEDITLEIASSQTYKGLKPTFTVSSSAGDLKDKLKLKPAVDFNNEWMNISASIELLPAKDAEIKKDYPKTLFSTVFGHKSCGFAAGLQTEFATNSRKLKNVHSIIGYSHSDLEITLSGQKKFDDTDNAPVTIGTTYYQKLANKWKDCALGGELSYSSQENQTHLSLGSSFKPDSTSTFKTRINNHGVLGFSYSQNWGGPFSVTLMGDINLLHSGSQEAAKFGAKVSLK